MSDRFLVVGGDAAGMSAAGKAKRDDPQCDVIVFKKGDWVSYGACGIPYYVEGEIADIEELQVLDPRKIVEEWGIDLRRHEEVVAVDPDEKTVTVENDDGRYDASYDDLLLATGGRAAMPDVPGTDPDGVFGSGISKPGVRSGATFSTRRRRTCRPLLLANRATARSCGRTCARPTSKSRRSSARTKSASRWPKRSQLASSRSTSSTMGRGSSRRSARTWPTWWPTTCASRG
jgi:hypothetical protein